ncbi:hypothetical protein F4777DRAFT_576440 [Nemania sp. FL0916]|nr:hypothetical protein F4777DRAFT_576440 [Nemania sp. FL0916]
MSRASYPPSLTLTAESNDPGKSHHYHQPSPILDRYVSEEPTVTGRLLGAKKRDAKTDRLDAAKKSIAAFDKQWSKKK